MSETSKLVAEYETFLAQWHTVLMATANVQGSPEASYAPFVREGLQFYVYVSQLSKHTQNLTVNPSVSLLWLENEQTCENLFARQRLSFECRASLIERHSAEWEQRLAQFEQQFGEIIQTLRELSDFKLFCLTPLQGNYVKGFGKAYKIVGDELKQLIHRRN